MMDLLSQLRDWRRDNLNGKKVHYRVRWSDELRQGTVARVKASTLFIGAECLHHDDLVSLMEV
jgi:hypothetical protein